MTSRLATESINVQPIQQMKILCAVVALFGVATPLVAQADTARARRASSAGVRELERARADTARTPMSPQQAPADPRLSPDISAVGDLIGDLAPKGSTQEDGTRFGIRELELALQAAVDPYFRGDVFIGFNDVDGVHIEQAFLTTTSHPGFELRLGRFLMPVGKQNTTHRHDLHTIEYPWVIQRFLGAEGLKGTGIYLSKVFAPLGFYQELQITAVDKFGEVEGLLSEEPTNQEIGGLGLSAR